MFSGIFLPDASLFPLQEQFIRHAESWNGQAVGYFADLEIEPQKNAGEEISVFVGLSVFGSASSVFNIPKGAPFPVYNMLPEPG